MERGEALMGTTIRPELSEKNPYWIEKHRYYEAFLSSVSDLEKSLFGS